jgi:hypothetical protein
MINPFIVLTESNRKTLVNVNHIIKIDTAQASGSILYLTPLQPGGMHLVRVAESDRQIQELILAIS